MFISDLFEEQHHFNFIVLYPGRFQPFHLGHREVFEDMQSHFGRDHVYIATSNKVSLPKSPFSFADKVAFMTAAGVPIDRILEVKNPYKFTQDETGLDPAKTVLIIVLGSPDAARLNTGGYKKDGKPEYYQPFEGLKPTMATADRHGYVIVIEEKKKSIQINNKSYDVSHGTQARGVWNMVRNDPTLRVQYLVQMFGRNDPALGHILDKIPANVSESVERIPFKENDSYEYMPPGAPYADTLRILNKTHQALRGPNKFIWLRPRDIGGSYSDQQLKNMGFQQSASGNWGGTEAMWANLNRK